MKNRIREHVNFVLKKDKYDLSFKNEMIEACEVEYNNAIENGLTEEEAYRYAIKDFDSEYFINAGDFRISKYSTLITFFITLASVLSFVLYNQFSVENLPLYSIWIVIIPNVILVLTKLLIVVLKFKIDLRYELKWILYSVLLYLPFILIELAGNRSDILNYMATLPIILVLIVASKIITSKKISLNQAFYLLISLAILVNYFILNRELYILELILKLVSILSVLTVGVIGLIKQKYKLTDILVIVGFVAITEGLLLIIGNRLDLYYRFNIITIVLLLALVIQLAFKNKDLRILNYIYIVNIYLVLFSLQVLYYDIYSLVKIGMHHITSYQYLMSMCMFLFLLLFQKYTYNKLKYK